jgi:hypothetical protein
MECKDESVEEQNIGDEGLIPQRSINNVARALQGQ